MSERVWIIIPVRNRLSLTMRCLDSLQQQSYPDMLTIVVDDGSSDGTAEALAEAHPEAVVLPASGDLWWTGATNLGIQHVLREAAAGDYVLTLNNDTTVPPEYLATLVRISRAHGDAALVGSVAVDSADRDTVLDGGPQVNWRTARHSLRNRGASLARVVNEGMREVHPDLLPGRGTLIPLAVIREIGVFDGKRLPHYGADYEFSRRAACAGHELIMSYEAPVFSEAEPTSVASVGKRLPWKRLLAGYVSRRSPACLLYRWRFGWLAAPKAWRVSYIALDTCRVIGSGLRSQLGRST